MCFDFVCKASMTSVSAERLLLMFCAYKTRTTFNDKLTAHDAAAIWVYLAQLGSSHFGFADIFRTGKVNLTPRKEKVRDLFWKHQTNVTHQMQFASIHRPRGSRRIDDLQGDHAVGSAAALVNVGRFGGTELVSLNHGRSDICAGSGSNLCQSSDNNATWSRPNFDWSRDTHQF